MKLLTLQIKRNHLDDILSGIKKQEFRFITPKNAKKYHEIDKDGEEVFEDGKFVTKKYDAIQFFNGYNANRPEATVEILSSEIELFEDEDGELIEFEEDNEKHYLAQIVFDLGKIISKINI